MLGLFVLPELMQSVQAKQTDLMFAQIIEHTK